MKKKMISLFLCSALIGVSASPVSATCFTSEPQAEEAMFSAGSAQEEEDTAELFTSLEEDEEVSDLFMAETDIDAEVTGLQIVKEPDRVEYYYGLEVFTGSDFFDLTGLQIEVSYSDNTRQLLEYEEFEEELCDSLGNTFSCSFTNMDGSEINTDATFLDKGDYLLTVEYDYDTDISDTTIVHSVDPADSQEMILGNNGIYTAGVKASGNFACAKFVPSESGPYIVTAEEPEDTYVSICDSSFDGVDPRNSTFVAGNTYYVYVDDLYERNSSVQFAAKKAPAIKSVELVKEPTRKFVYQYLESRLSLIGGLLEITYEDGTSETIYTGDAYGTHTQYGEEVKFSLNPDGSASDLKPGTYDAYVFVGDYKVNTVIKNVKIKSLNEMPIINGKGEKSVPTYGSLNVYMRFKTGKTTKYLIQSSFHSETVNVTELGEKGTEGRTISVSEGKVCTLKPNTTYLLSLTVTGDYLPSKVSFIVTPSSKSYNFSKSKISGTTTFAYTGKEVKPNFTVKYGKKTLKKDKDYSITYYNNKNLGTARAVLYGKGLYSGIIEKQFKIQLKTPSVKAAKSGSSAIKVSWPKVTGAQGYVVERSTGKTWSKVATVKGKTYFTDKKVKKGMTYKYRVRAYCKVNNKNTYSSYSSVKAIKR